jgi:hypothetical protein
MNTETHFITPNKNTEIDLVIPVPDIGNGEESLVVSIMENSIKFEVMDDEDNVIYQISDSYEDFCNYIEARDLYVDAAILRHPANTLQIIDGGGNK